jgi:hypothetical protein
MPKKLAPLTFVSFATVLLSTGLMYWQALAAVSVVAPFLTFAVPSVMNEAGQFTSSALAGMEKPSANAPITPEATRNRYPFIFIITPEPRKLLR